jgi:hypothetical protein
VLSGSTHDRWERAVAVVGIACSGGTLRVGWEKASLHLSIFAMAGSFRPFVTNKNAFVQNKKYSTQSKYISIPTSTRGII